MHYKVLLKHPFNQTNAGNGLITGIRKSHDERCTAAGHDSKLDFQLFNLNNMTPATHQLHPVSYGKRMLQGAGIAFLLISIFLYGVKDPNPLWPKYWMAKPLIIVPVAGAIGGLFYHFMGHLRNQDGWKKWLANVASLIGYLIALWLGTVLGLNGTLWN